jgi:hypothetical protein
MDDADFFIADITGANPNVMMELGAAYAGHYGKPVILIARISAPGAVPELPADLAGHIAATYVEGSDSAHVAAQLEKEFLKHSGLMNELNRDSRERFVSPEMLRVWTDGVLKAPDVYEKLSVNVPTASAWRSATHDSLERVVTDRRDRYHIDSVLAMVRDNLLT